MNGKGLNGPPGISRSEVAHLIEWSTEGRSDKLTCEVREDVELPDRWGARATQHIHEYLSKYRIEVVGAGQNQFIGHIREIGSMVIEKKTQVGNLRGVLLQLADSISININKQLIADWTDEEWNNTAAAANKIMREVANPLQEGAE